MEGWVEAFSFNLSYYPLRCRQNHSSRDRQDLYSLGTPKLPLFVYM
jgi:hypothetical protein